MVEKDDHRSPTAVPPKASQKKSAGKDKEKKKSSAVEDLESPGIIDDQPILATTATPTVDLIAEEVKPEEEPEVEEVEVKYEEPVLTLIIVEK